MFIVMMNALVLLLLILFAPVSHAAGGNADAVDPLARKITGSIHYVPFFGIRTAVTSNYEIAGLIAVDVGLEIPDDKIRAMAISRRARINDAMRVALAAYSHRSHIAGEAPNAKMIKLRLQRAVDRELGQGVALVTLASLILFDE